MPPQPQNKCGHVGLASELRVAADLLLKGYQVYSAFRVGNIFDLVISKDSHIFLKVEVKTANRFKSSPIMWVKNPDILALVNYEGKIVYIKKPGIESF